jgi:hypothetical protein
MRLSKFETNLRNKKEHKDENIKFNLKKKKHIYFFKVLFF